MTSPTHSKFVRKIVFASTAIEKGKENESGFKNSFTMKDEIYGRVYLANAINNEVLLGGGRPEVATYFTMFIDGKEALEWRCVMTAMSNAEWTTLQVVLAPGATDKNEYNQVPGKFAKVIAGLEPGSHNIKIALQFSKTAKPDNLASKELASGEFSFAVDANAKAFLAEKGAKMPEPGIKDAALEAECLAAMQGQFKTSTPLRVVITDRDWTYQRHQISGVITQRSIVGAVSSKHDDGSCRVIEYFFCQENLGGTTYGKAKYCAIKNGGRNYDIPCENAK